MKAKHHNIPIKKLESKYEKGFRLKEFGGDIQTGYPEFSHRDAYYMFGILSTGTINAEVDFVDATLSSKDIFFLIPGQVHHFKSVNNASGYILFINSELLSDELSSILYKYVGKTQTITTTTKQKIDIENAFKLLSNNQGTTFSKDIAIVIIDLVLNSITQNEIAKPKVRLQEIISKLRCQIEQHIYTQHSPTFYASQLNITTGYLNEAVSELYGISTTQLLKNEIILRIKRELVYSTKTIQEISIDMGFYDYSYFSRLFNKVEGMSPTAFRAKHLE